MFITGLIKRSLVIIFLVHCATSCEDTILNFNFYELQINNTFVTVPWMTTPNNVTANFTVILHSGNSTFSYNAGNRRIYNILRSDLPMSSNVNFYIYIKGTCDDINFMSHEALRISTQVTTLKKTAIPNETFCLMAMSPNLLFAFPISNNEEDSYCTCPPYDIAGCDCIQGTNIYGVHAVNNPEPMICWRNITNNSKIYLLMNVLPDQTLDLPRHVTVIEAIYEIQLKEVPHCPIVTSNEEDKLLCFNDDYNGNAIPKNYTILVYDNTGYGFKYVQTGYEASQHNVTKCEQIPKYLQNPECYPLNVSITGLNEVGYSETANLPMFNGEEKRNSCNCFNNNVDISLQFTNISDPQKYLMVLCCKSKYNTNTDNITVLVKLILDGKNVDEISVNCSEAFEFNSLKECSIYYVQLLWIHESFECPISHGLISFNTAYNDFWFTTYIISYTVLTILIILISFSAYWLYTSRILRRKRKTAYWGLDTEKITLKIHEHTTSL